MKRTTKNAVKKYGAGICVRAYTMHLEGFGASGIAAEGPSILRTTQAADAAINAGRELEQEWQKRWTGCTLRADQHGCMTSKFADGYGCMSYTLDTLGLLMVTAEARRNSAARCAMQSHIQNRE